MRKRSVVIRGHATSVSLEEPFWTELKALAAQNGASLGRFIEGIDAERGEVNLSSALRLAVLAALKRRLDEGEQRRG